MRPSFLESDSFATLDHQPERGDAFVRILHPDPVSLGFDSFVRIPLSNLNGFEPDRLEMVLDRITGRRMKAEEWL